MIFLIVLFAFCSEFIDSSLGMGYGTTLTPILLAMGYSPLEVVPAILLSELITGFFSAFLFNKAKIVNFDFRHDPEYSKFLYIPKSHDARIVFLLSFCSIIGCMLSVSLAIHLPKIYLQIGIGSIVFVMGVFILIKKNKSQFSWTKVFCLGGAAAFNKGMSGGGYGPLMTAGQILCGANTKNSIAITSFTEAFTCFIGLVTYFYFGKKVYWNLAFLLIIGAVLSVPLAVYTIKKVELRSFTKIVGIATILLGSYTLAQAILFM